MNTTVLEYDGYIVTDEGAILESPIKVLATEWIEGTDKLIAYDCTGIIKYIIDLTKYKKILPKERYIGNYFKLTGTIKFIDVDDCYYEVVKISRFQMVYDRRNSR